jgi:hypothetical protein
MRSAMSTLRSFVVLIGALSIFPVNMHAQSLPPNVTPSTHIALRCANDRDGIGGVPSYFNPNNWMKPLYEAKSAGCKSRPSENALDTIGKPASSWFAWISKKEYAAAADAGITVAFKAKDATAQEGILKAQENIEFVSVGNWSDWLSGPYGSELTKTPEGNKIADLIKTSMFNQNQAYECIADGKLQGAIYGYRGSMPPTVAGEWSDTTGLAAKARGSSEPPATMSMGHWITAVRRAASLKCPWFNKAAATKIRDTACSDMSAKAAEGISFDWADVEVMAESGCAQTPAIRDKFKAAGRRWIYGADIRPQYVKAYEIRTTSDWWTVVPNVE